MRINKEIRVFVMDVDGTLTDGKIYITSDGEFMKTFNIKDGYAIVSALRKGIIPVIITGRTSQITAQRCNELGIEYIYQGVKDKRAKLYEVLAELDIQPEQIAYIGDDINDIECMRICGYSACPADAVNRVKDIVHYVCRAKGGRGAVREFIETFMNIE